MAGLDGGAYERLRKIYNSLDIPGPIISAAEDMEIATLCKHPFCRWAVDFVWFVLFWVALGWVALGAGLCLMLIYGFGVVLVEVALYLGWLGGWFGLLFEVLC